MNPQEFSTFLQRTLDDKRLSRNERRVITDLVGDLGNDEQKLGQFRQLAVQAAAQVIDHPQATVILEWLEDVLKALQPRTGPVAPPPAAGTPVTPGNAIAEAYFSPGDQCCQRLISFLNSARKTLDLCVFTITDDRIARPICDAHRRGVKVRIVSDDEKSGDLGSDIEEFRRAGIPVKLDSSPAHMHHKFALADGSLVLTGSYNWTRSASMNNQENFIVSNDARLVAAFMREFEKLWKQFG